MTAPQHHTSDVAYDSAREAVLAELLLELLPTLVDQSSRTQVEHTVCNRLAATDLYESACVFTPAIDGDGMQRLTTSGDANPVSETDPSARGHPTREANLAATAYRTGEVGTVRPDGSHELAAIAIPLRHERIVSGVLVLRTTDRGAFGDRERTGLTALGETVGFVMTALRRRELLFGDAVVELTFRIEDPESVLLHVSAALGCTLKVSGQIALEEGWLLYIDVEDTAASDVATTLAPAVDDARVVSAEDQWNRIECVLADSSLLDTIVATGASIRSAQVDRGQGRFVIEAPVETDLRDLVAQLRDTVASLEVQSVTEHERAPQRARGPDGLLGLLTDRQQDAITAAYRAGYYDWPRQSTAEEVAATLDIAPPTLHAHLRKAEASLLAELFDSKGVHD